MSYGKALATLEEKNATVEQLIDCLIGLGFDSGYLQALIFRGLISSESESQLLRMVVLSDILRKRLLDKIAASRSSVLIFVNSRQMIRICGRLAKTRRAEV